MNLKMLNKLPTDTQHLSAILLISLLALFGYVFAVQIEQFFIYDRSLIKQGQVWRMLTGHLFHTNGYHLILNLFALWMLWALHGDYYSFKNITLLFITSGVVCSAGLFYFSPTITQYVGLSGILHGLFTFGAFLDLAYKYKKTEKATLRMTGLFMLIGVTIKLVHEQLVGANEQVSKLIEANVAIDAHLWGAIGGLLFVLLYWLTCHLMKNDG
jgi:rhomboid family GlyGly-CTERM serine protease